MDTQYKPGDQIPSSGLYKCTHRNGHAPAHEVTALFGETFPACKTCGYKVTFELIYAAVHVRAHPQFQ